ncbi:hypothetical protein Cadr_000025068 [Camelus dromedarius]|uniref:Uncharacterized protein n=1 Tax=Camelus dromedarius TaxID=9838 RepID=A0A5N4CML3_CAMDR|nr:hypothetical protein Cadr_000025068 [Camelus dromedarius]
MKPSERQGESPPHARTHAEGRWGSEVGWGPVHAAAFLAGAAGVSPGTQTHRDFAAASGLSEGEFSRLQSPHFWDWLEETVRRITGRPGSCNAHLGQTGWKPLEWATGQRDMRGQDGHEMVCRGPWENGAEEEGPPISVTRLAGLHCGNEGGSQRDRARRSPVGPLSGARLRERLRGDGRGWLLEGCLGLPLQSERAWNSRAPGQALVWLAWPGHPREQGSTCGGGARRREEVLCTPELQPPTLRCHSNHHPDPAGRSGSIQLEPGGPARPPGEASTTRSWLPGIPPGLRPPSAPGLDKTPRQGLPAPPPLSPPTPAGYHAIEGLPAPLQNLPDARAVLPACLALPDQGGVGSVVAVLDLGRGASNRLRGGSDLLGPPPGEGLWAAHPAQHGARACSARGGGTHLAQRVHCNARGRDVSQVALRVVLEIEPPPHLAARPPAQGGHSPQGLLPAPQIVLQNDAGHRAALAHASAIANEEARTLPAREQDLVGGQRAAGSGWGTEMPPTPDVDQVGDPGITWQAYVMASSCRAERAPLSEVMSGGGTLDSVLVSTTRSGCCFPILAGGAGRSGAGQGLRSAWGRHGRGPPREGEGQRRAKGGAYQRSAGTRWTHKTLLRRKAREGGLPLSYSLRLSPVLWEARITTPVTEPLQFPHLSLRFKIPWKGTFRDPRNPAPLAGQRRSRLLGLSSRRTLTLGRHVVSVGLCMAQLLCLILLGLTAGQVLSLGGWSCPPAAHQPPHQVVERGSPSPQYSMVPSWNLTHSRCVNGSGPPSSPGGVGSSDKKWRAGEGGHRVLKACKRPTGQEQLQGRWREEWLKCPTGPGPGLRGSPPLSSSPSAGHWPPACCLPT